jgi:hypothetical protein
MLHTGGVKKAAVGCRTYPTGGSQKSRDRFRRVINGSSKTGSRWRRAPKLQKAPPGSVLGDVFVCFLRFGLGEPRRTNHPVQLRNVALDTPFVGRPVLETPETVPILRPLRMFFLGQTRPEASKSSPGFGCFFLCFWRCALGTPPRTHPPAQLCHVAVVPSCIVYFAPDWYKLCGLSLCITTLLLWLITQSRIPVLIRAPTKGWEKSSRRVRHAPRRKLPKERPPVLGGA